MTHKNSILKLYINQDPAAKGKINLAPLMAKMRLIVRINSCEKKTKMAAKQISKASVASIINP